MTTHFALLPDGRYINMDHVRYLSVDENYFVEDSTDYVVVGHFADGKVILFESQPTYADARHHLASIVRQLNAP